MSKKDQLEKSKTAPGFIAALDQSGGSTPKALGLYGVTPDAWSNDEEMFDVVHAMRTRIMTSPAFGGDRILGAILFENTMDREVEGQSTAGYLWNVKNVVPFLKVDKGLADVVDGAQVMKPMPDLDVLLEKANAVWLQCFTHCCWIHFYLHTEDGRPAVYALDPKGVPASYENDDRIFHPPTKGKIKVTETIDLTQFLDDRKSRNITMKILKSKM